MTTTTPLLSDVITYVRRILKTPNQQDITDLTIQDYVNRFYIYDIPARIQILDLKVQYSLELQPNVDRYPAPVTYLPSGAVIPTYNSFLTPAYIDGYQIVMQQSHEQWYKLFPNRYKNGTFASGNGTAGPYVLNFDNVPVIRGFRDQNIQTQTSEVGLITGITQAVNAVVSVVNTFVVGQQVLISGVNGMTEVNGLIFLIIAQTPTTITLNVNSTGFSLYQNGGTATSVSNAATDLGLLDSAVFVTAMDAAGNNLVAQDDGRGNLIGDVNPGAVNTVNYLTGAVTITFSNPIPAGAPFPLNNNINAQFIPYTARRPQAVLLYDNTFSFRPVPSMPFLFQIDAYYNPAAFLNSTNSIPYRWMAEYIARGTARKILTDYGDAEQLAFYEPYFREQENFVLRKTYRQNSNTRVGTIYQGQTSFMPGAYNNL